MKTKKLQLSLTTQIFLALVLAIIVGVFLTKIPEIATDYIAPFGKIFLNLIKWIVCPLVFFSIMSGVISLQDIKKIGSIGGKTLFYYLCTTAFAVAIGLFFANSFKGIFPLLATSNLSYEAAASVSFMENIVNIFPKNFIAPFSDANMLQVIVSSLLIGFAVIGVGNSAKRVVDAINLVNDIFVMGMEMILKLSPIGVFCLLCPVVAKNGPVIIGSLAMVLFVAYLCYVVHAVFVYSVSVKAFAAMSPITFFKGMMPAILFAFSSASSVGTLPLSMECTEKLGAKKEISSFILPLGATINMDGTAIYQGVCSVFIASCFGINLTLVQMLTIVLTATLASIGTAGVPGAGMVMLAMVLQSVGLPVEGIAIVAGIDRLFDMGRTTVNITGDAACCMVINAIESRKMKEA
ncbi:dicarboxylate/amino acid:cation symporter [Fusobacterium necrophorum]|uniref:dicarboxylate/amino acid:cation symporter n=1 Tax=Fusobacterium necrophorum TaxID=859 RepID=UPI00370F4E2F